MALQEIIRLDYLHVYQSTILKKWVKNTIICKHLLKIKNSLKLELIIKPRSKICWRRKMNLTSLLWELMHMNFEKKLKNMKRNWLSKSKKNRKATIKLIFLINITQNKGNWKSKQKSWKIYYWRKERRAWIVTKSNTALRYWIWICKNGSYWNWIIIKILGNK
jgi:hypothetical protein